MPYLPKKVLIERKSKQCTQADLKASLRICYGYNSHECLAFRRREQATT